jgi:hypothetical protein
MKELIKYLEVEAAKADFNDIQVVVGHPSKRRQRSQ